jgi:protocatechuate 3,4-dioxygenase beta subunit
VAETRDRGGTRALTRREALAATAATGAAIVIAACGGDDEGSTAASETAPPETAAHATTLTPTPACGDGDETPEQTEGPYFISDSPERTSLLEAGTVGTPLVLTGRVLSTACQPVPRALLDFWQADGAGEYDLEGYGLRGNQFTDAEGRFRLETVRPGLYPGRTPHIHVKAQPEGGRVLTTQLYFPGESGNESDGIFDPALLVDLKGEAARFDFVLETPR